jgi:sec-independent protein translocase protein TatC
MVSRIIVPASLLFAAGAIFSYLLVIPFAFTFLYAFAPAGTVQFVSIMTLVSFTLQFMIAFGLSFQLPIFMWILTKVGIVQPRFWRDNWRYAFVAMVIFGAVITPDGSGITMWFVAMPMAALYFGGYIVAKRSVFATPAGGVKLV